MPAKRRGRRASRRGRGNARVEHPEVPDAHEENEEELDPPRPPVEDGEDEEEMPALLEMHHEEGNREEKLDQHPVDVDTVLRVKLDESLEDNPKRKKLPSLDKLLGLVDKLSIPMINLSEEPDTLQVLLFLQKMEAYRDEDGNIPNPILERAFVGSEEQEWIEKLETYEEIKNKMLNRLFREEGWVDVCSKLRKGQRLSQNLREHIRSFKLVALYLGRR